MFANSVVSLCAQSGIAASDAVLIVNGVERRSRASHEQAPTELRRIGQNALATQLSRLLRLKPKAQYTSGPGCKPGEAFQAMNDARRAIAIATEYLKKEASN